MNIKIEITITDGEGASRGKVRGQGESHLLALTLRPEDDNGLAGLTDVVSEQAASVVSLRAQPPLSTAASEPRSVTITLTPPDGDTILNEAVIYGSIRRQGEDQAIIGFSSSASWSDRKSLPPGAYSLDFHAPTDFGKANVIIKVGAREVARGAFDTATRRPGLLNFVVP